MASIKDVATRAGVSIATVSRVMNDKGPISEKAKAAVYQAMEELNYQPNELARALGKKKQSKIIGLLSLPLQHPFYSELVTAIEEQLFQRGYKLMVITSFGDIMKEENCLNLIQSHLLDGLIIGGHPVDREGFLNCPVPIITIEAQLSGVPCVISDNYQGGILATQHLLAKGCKNLVHISGDSNLHHEADNRAIAFEEACANAGVSHWVYATTTEMLKELNYSRLVNQILFEHPDVDGIFASSDVIAAEVVKSAVSLGFDVPNQLKVVGFDNVKLSQLYNPPITTISQDIDGLAQITVEKLIGMIEQEGDFNGAKLSGEEVAPCMVPVNLIQRQST